MYLLGLSFVVFCTTLVADVPRGFFGPKPKDPPPQEVNAKNVQGYQMGHERIKGGYDVTLSASSLFWKAQEGGLDFAIKNTGSTIVIDDPGHVKRARFDWNWGVRLGLGYEIPTQSISLQGDWTHYTANGTKSVSAEPPSILFSVWSIPVDILSIETKAKATSHLKMDMLDLGIRSTFSPRRFLDITPFMDLSTLWIDQDFCFVLSGGEVFQGRTVIRDQIDMSNDFWGIGPKLGMDTVWILGRGFGLIANLNFSLLYGLFSIKQKEVAQVVPGDPFTFLNVGHNKFHLARFNFDTFIGLRYSSLFSGERYKGTLEAGWENLIFFGQNQLMRFLSIENNGLNFTANQDLTIQGLTMRAALTF